LLKTISIFTFLLFSFLSHAATLSEIERDAWEAYNLHHKSSAIINMTTRDPVSIDDVSPQNLENTALALEHYAKKLSSLSDSNLSQERRLDRDTLLWILKEESVWMRSPYRRLTFNTVYSWFDIYLDVTSSQQWSSDSLYKSYHKRLSILPNYIHQQKALLMEGLEIGLVQSCHATNIHIDAMHDYLSDHALFLSPIQEKWESYGDDDKALLNAKSHKAKEAMVQYLDFVENTYAPNCREKASSLPPTPKAYADILRYYTSTDMSPSQLHEMGLKEVDKLLNEAESLIHSPQGKQALNVSSTSELFALMRNTPSFFAENEDAILERAELVLHQAKKNAAKYFDYPDDFAKLHVVPIPPIIAEHAPAGFYQQGGDYGGTIYVNTSKPTQRNIYTIPSLMLHEGIPGHHFQIYSRLNDNSLAPYRSAYYFQAISEGWGLYAESYGQKLIEDYSIKDKVGTLSMALLRAARLVVDTGIHSKDWSREKSISYLTSVTAASPLVIKNEVERFISLPGQATTYQVGYSMIKLIRKTAEQELGVNFNEKEFNQFLLKNTTLPLTVFQKAFNEWLLETKKVLGDEL